MQKPVPLPAFRIVPQRRPETTVVVTGQDIGDGESVMRHLLHTQRTEVDMGVVISPCPQTRKAYEQMLPSTHVHSTYSRSRLGAMCEAQARLGAERPAAPGRHVAIVLDGVQLQRADGRGLDESVRFLLANGVCMDMSLFLRVDPAAPWVPRKWGGHVHTWVFAPSIAGDGALLARAFHEVLRDGFATLDDCRAAFESLQAHEYLVFRPHTARRRLPALYKLDVGEPLPDFRLGADWVWRMHYKYASEKHLQPCTTVTHGAPRRPAGARHPRSTARQQTAPSTRTAGSTPAHEPCKGIPPCLRRGQT